MRLSILDDKGYELDEAAASNAVEFFSDMLIHVKGRQANQPFVLLPWQADIVRELFGRKRADGTRRYRKVYIECPRKNGKSLFAAGLALYILLCDGEQGAEVYSAASTRDQASLVYSMAAQMLRKSPILSKHVTIRDSVKRINHPKSASFYRAIAADSAAAHGFNAHGIIFDELHTMPDRELWDVLDTSTGARTQPLTIAITTAGHDRSTICWEMHQYAEAVRDGHIDDDGFLPVIFSAGPDDDWRDESVWERVNPSLGVSVTWDYLREQAARAEENPAFENTFRRLHLNQWTQQESRIISMASWDDCEHEVDWSGYDGRSCFAGLDLASTMDVTAFVLAFPEDDGGMTVRPWFWIPEDNISKKARADQRLVRNFGERGDVETTPGNEVDVIYLAERIMEICQNYDVRYMGYDPWNAAGVVQLLQSHGMPLHAIQKMSQGSSTYNEPFKRLLSWLGNGKFRHDGNVVLRWMAGNTSHREDVNGNIRPDKGRSADKIDGICAMLMACGLLINYGSEHGAYMEAGSGVVLF